MLEPVKVTNVNGGSIFDIVSSPGRRQPEVSPGTATDSWESCSFTAGWWNEDFTGWAQVCLSVCCCKICTRHHSNPRTRLSPPTHSLLYRAPWPFSNETETLQISNQPTLDRQEKVLSNPRSAPEVNSLEGDVPLSSATLFVFVKDPIFLVSPAIFWYNVINVLLHRKYWSGPDESRVMYLGITWEKQGMRSRQEATTLSTWVHQNILRILSAAVDKIEAEQQSKICTFDPIKPSRKKYFSLMWRTAN